MESFSLSADLNYVASNAPRLARALYEICVHRGWSSAAELCLTLSKASRRPCTCSQRSRSRLLPWMWSLRAARVHVHVSKHRNGVRVPPGLTARPTRLSRAVV